MTFPTEIFFPRFFSPWLAGLFSRVVNLGFRFVTQTTPTSLHRYSLSSVAATMLKFLLKFSLLPSFRQTVIFTG